MKLILLTQGQFAKVDDADFVRFAGVKWFAAWAPCAKSFYAARNSSRPDGTQRQIKLHREIMGNPAGKLVDHENHDTLDCRKKNLRICTAGQNNSNRSGSQRTSMSGKRGVCWMKDRSKWRAQLGFRKKKLFLGDFTRKASAVSAYAAGNRKYFGEFGGVI